FMLAGIVPMLATAMLAVYRPPFFARLDDATYDVVVRAAGTRPPGGRVAIVDVDERSLAAVGQWPWRRDVMGRLVSKLRDSGAAVIAIDVIFAEADRQSGSGAAGSGAPAEAPDEALAGVLRDGGVVLGYGLTFDPVAPSTRGCVLRPLPLVVVRPPADERV